MLSVVAILAVLLAPVVVLVVVMLAVEARQRARADVAFQPWRVVFPLPEGRVRDTARLMVITNRVVGAQLTATDELQIVFTRSTHTPRVAAA